MTERPKTLYSIAGAVPIICYNDNCDRGGIRIITNVNLEIVEMLSLVTEVSEESFEFNLVDVLHWLL